MRALTRVKKVGLTLLKSKVRPGLRGAKRVKKNGGEQTQLDGCRNKGFIGNLVGRNYSETDTGDY